MIWRQAFTKSIIFSLEITLEPSSTHTVVMFSFEEVHVFIGYVLQQALVVLYVWQ